MSNAFLVGFAIGAAIIAVWGFFAWFDRGNVVGQLRKANERLEYLALDCVAAGVKAETWEKRYAVLSKDYGACKEENERLTERCDELQRTLDVFKSANKNLGEQRDTDSNEINKLQSAADNAVLRMSKAEREAREATKVRELVENQLSRTECNWQAFFDSEMGKIAATIAITLPPLRPACSAAIIERIEEASKRGVEAIEGLTADNERMRAKVSELREWITTRIADAHSSVLADQMVIDAMFPPHVEPFTISDAEAAEMRCGHAYVDGRNAFRAAYPSGVDDLRNPYPFPSDEHDEWEEGYNAAKAELAERVAERIPMELGESP